jgi:hypothetical protein
MKILNLTNLAKLSKDEIKYYIEEKIKEQKESFQKETNATIQNITIDTLVLDYSPNRLASFKVVEITLNESRSWCWGTPWKFAYSYKGSHGFKTSIFYIEF